MNLTPITIGAKPGVQKDGTRYISDYATDAKNTRFDEDYARTILGWESLFRGNGEIARTIVGVPNSQSNDVYLGRASTLSYFNLPTDEAVPPGGEVIRVPAGTFPVYANNLWSLDSFTFNGATDPDTKIVGHVAPNASDISSEVLGPVFIGNQSDNAPFTQIIDSGSGLPVLLSGGVVCYDNLIVGLTNKGIIRWAKQDTPLDWGAGGTPSIANQQSIGNTKCVAAVPYQGSLILFTLNKIYRLTYDATTNQFDVQEYQGTISILSAQSITVYFNNIYWVGQGTFYQFNGTLGRIPNKMCKNYFFDNLTYNQKGKISSFIDYQNDEWWVLFPRDNSVENNDAVMYYPASNVWSSTDITRATSANLTNYRYRVMSSNTLYTTTLGSGQTIQTYPIWIHEKGLNEVFNGVATPIESYVTYPVMDYYSSEPSAANNVCIQSERIEPDFVLKGAMQFEVISRMYAQSQPVVAGPYTFTGTTEFVDIAPIQGRQISVRFISNVLDGYFEIGRTLHGIKKGSAAA